MATANTTAAPQEPCVKPLGAAAVADLCKFISITKENPQALAMWDEYIRDGRPIIDGLFTTDRKPVLFLAKPLASFLGAEVNHD